MVKVNVVVVSMRIVEAAKSFESWGAAMAVNESVA